MRAEANHTNSGGFFAGRRLMPVRFILSGWLFVLSAIAFLDRTNISIAAPQISHLYGLGNQKLGWIFSAFLIGYASCQIPAGWLAAKYGPRRVLTFSALAWAAITSITTMIPQVPFAIVLLLGLRFVLGASEAAMYPAANQFVAQWIPLRERGRINGLIFAGVGAGSGLTPPLLVWLIGSYGWRATFWFSSVVAVCAALVWWLLSRDSPRQHPLVTSDELRQIEQDQPPRGADLFKSADEISSTHHRRISWRSILGSRDLPFLMLSYFGFCYIAWIFFSWFFLYMAQARGFDMKTSARYTMLPFLSMTLCCLLGGAISDLLTQKYGLRTGRCMLAAASSLATGIFLVLGSQVRSPGVAAIILAGGAGLLYLSQSSYWSVAIEIAGRESGVYSSIINMAGQIGGAVTASFTPWLATRYGWTMSFGIAAFIALVASACWMTVNPQRTLSERKRKQKPDLNAAVL